MLPTTFLLRMEQVLYDEFPAFLEALDATPPTSIRCNSRKGVSLPGNFEKVKWNEEGVYIPERPIFTLDPAFHAGGYYVQEASSMFIAEALRQLVDLSQPLKVLDLCAAPGGKTTLLSSILSPDSLLVANEVIKPRFRILEENVIRWGMPNVLLTSHDPEHFAGLKNYFDIVLVDAPCSGEGLFRKTPAYRAEWSEELVRMCASRQRRILAEAQELVKPGGWLLYSTCTFNDLENIDNADWLRQNFPLASRQLTLEDDWNIVEREEGQAWGYQFFPHRVQGEGFFLSVFQNMETGWLPEPSNQINFSKYKPISRKLRPAVENWLAEPDDLALCEHERGDLYAIPQSLLPDFAYLAGQLKRFKMGVKAGLFKGNDFIPAHSLALSLIASPHLPTVELTSEQALRFLKREVFPLETAQSGWQIVRYNSLNLGWIKALPNRINNYLPMEWRIRMDLPPTDEIQ